MEVEGERRAQGEYNISREKEQHLLEGEQQKDHQL